MNQSNDKYLSQQSKSQEIVNTKLKQIRHRVFGQAAPITHTLTFNKPFFDHEKDKLQDRAQEALFQRISDGGYTKSHARSESVNNYSSKRREEIENKQNSYQNRIKNLDVLGGKIKEMLERGNPVSNNVNKINNYTFLKDQSIKQKNSQKYEKYLQQICEKKLKQKNQNVTQRKLIKEQLKLNHYHQRHQTPKETQPQNLMQKMRDSQNYQNFNNIQDKLRQLRLNRAKIKAELGLKQKEVNFAKNKQVFNDKSKQNNCLNNKRQSIQIIATNYNQQSSNNENFIKQKINYFDSIKQVQSIQIKRQPSNQIQKVQTTKLAEILGQQISKDQKMRQYRNVFSLLINQQKWDSLKQYLENYKVYKQIQVLKQELTMSSEQHNPFDQIQPNISQSQCMKNLAKFYSQSLIFWQTNLIGCVSIAKLQRESFTIRDIDLNKKGFLSIEDIVCFINLYSGNFFRSRDIIMMYRRLVKGTKSNLSYENFLQIITTD